MHPYILMDLASIRTAKLIDEARATALASQLRRQARLRPARSVAAAATDGCLLCGRSPCTCPVAT
jgi:hypothetical protein